MQKTVKVRIAVAVDQYGEWNAVGWTSAQYGVTSNPAMDLAVEGIGENENRYYITAELQIPEIKEVVGKVESVDD